MIGYPYENRVTGLRQNGFRAFTVIEILVVTVVLVGLMVLMISHFSGLTDKTATINCQHQLRQLWGGMNQYMAENNGRFIPIADEETRFGGTVAAWGPTWAEYFARFYFEGSKKILHCPSRPDHWSNAAGFYPDYSYNQRLPQQGYFVTFSAVTRPDETLMFVDGGRFSGGRWVGGIHSLADPSRVYYRHVDNVANAVYVSGRVTPHAEPVGIDRSDKRHPFNPWVFRDP